MERRLRKTARIVSILPVASSLNQRILIKKAWPAQAEWAKLKLTIGWRETAS
jgi:hypothetical protein